MRLFVWLKGDGQQMGLVARKAQPFQDVAGKPADVTAVPTLRQRQGRSAREQRPVLAGSSEIQSQLTCLVSTKEHTRMDLGT